jgi:hypothetical protein
MHVVLGRNKSVREEMADGLSLVARGKFGRQRRLAKSVLVSPLNALPQTAPSGRRPITPIYIYHVGLKKG